MKPLIFLSLLLIASPVWGCDSFEDCMEPKLKDCPEYIGYSKDLQTGVTHNNYLHKPCEQPNYLKSICYKLDEISKKLDFSDEERSFNRRQEETSKAQKEYHKYLAKNLGKNQ